MQTKLLPFSRFPYLRISVLIVFNTNDSLALLYAYHLSQEVNTIYDSKTNWVMERCKIEIFGFGPLSEKGKLLLLCEYVVFYELTNISVTKNTFLLETCKINIVVFGICLTNVI